MPALHSPTRGTPPRFACGTIIPPLSITPLPSAAHVRVSCFLPIGEGFTTKQFTDTIPTCSLVSFLKHFEHDPEKTLEDFFSEDPWFKPQLRKVLKDKTTVTNNTELLNLL